MIQQSFIVIFLLLLSFNATSHVLSDEKIQQSVNAVLGIMGFSVVPDVTSGSVSIDNNTTSNPEIFMTNLAGGATLSKSFPLYLEGGLAYSRYNPKYVVNEGPNQTNLQLKWNSILLSGGVGWDIPIAKNWVIRPIFNVSLGHMESDLSIAGRVIGEQTGINLKFLDGGRMNAYGLGGSLMLDYEDYTPERDIDLEWRYSNIQLKSFDTPSAISGTSDSIASSLYARWRAPLAGITLLNRPVRYVLEGAHTTYLGDQRGILGFNNLSSLGLGIELDSSAYNVFVTRTRLVGRYMFGHNVSGFTIGLAMSF